MKARTARPGSGAVPSLLTALSALLFLPALGAAQEQDPVQPDRAEDPDVRLWTTGTYASVQPRAVVELDRPAYVALFEVERGTGAVMLHPLSRGENLYLGPGEHRLRLTGAGVSHARRVFRHHLGHRLAFTSAHRPTSFLVVVASVRPLRISNLLSGRVFSHRGAHASRGAITEELLREIVPNHARGGWSYDIHTFSKFRDPALLSFFGFRSGFASHAACARHLSHFARDRIHPFSTAPIHARSQCAGLVRIPWRIPRFGPPLHQPSDDGAPEARDRSELESIPVAIPTPDDLMDLEVERGERGPESRPVGHALPRATLGLPGGEEEESSETVREPVTVAPDPLPEDARALLRDMADARSRMGSSLRRLERRRETLERRGVVSGRDLERLRRAAPRVRNRGTIGKRLRSPERLRQVDSNLRRGAGTLRSHDRPHRIRTRGLRNDRSRASNRKPSIRSVERIRTPKKRVDRPKGKQKRDN